MEYARMDGAPVNLQDTAQLISRIQDDDRSANEILLSRYYPHLLSLLHNRLNPHQRRQKDTQDLIQEIFLRVLPALKNFEYRGIGSFWAFLRQVAINHLRKAWKQQAREHMVEPLSKESSLAPASPEPGPLEAIQVKEEFELYERAIEILDKKEKDIVLMRVELGCAYKLIADEVGSASPEAARKACVRALEKVYREMHRAKKG